MSAREVRRGANAVPSDRISVGMFTGRRVGNDETDAILRIEDMAREEESWQTRTEVKALTRSGHSPMGMHEVGPGQVVCPKCRKPTFSETTAYASGMIQVTRWKCRPCLWISEPTEASDI